MSEGTAVVVSLQKNLASLRERVEALQVVTPEDYVNVCNLIVEGRAFIKRWEEVDGPGIRSAKDHLDLLRNEHKTHVMSAEQIVAAATLKKEGYAEQERKKAQAEADVINAKARHEQERLRLEARKKHAAAPPPPQQVEVKPLIPSVAGVKNQVYYFAECTEEDRLIREFLGSGPERRGFLRQFFMVNQQAVGKFARDTKDNKEVEKALPGVKAWSKG